MCQWNKRSTWDTREFLESRPRHLHLPVNGPREHCCKLNAQNKNWTADLQSRTRTPMDGWRCMMPRLEGPLGKQQQQQHPWSLLSDCIIWILSLCIYSIIFLTMFAYMANLCLYLSVFVPMSQLGVGGLHICQSIGGRVQTSGWELCVRASFRSIGVRAESRMAYLIMRCEEVFCLSLVCFTIIHSRQADRYSVRW